MNGPLYSVNNYGLVRHLPYLYRRDGSSVTKNKMKALFTSAVLALLIATATNVRAQDWQEDYLGLPGDNLNLYAAMKLFQESETLEGFEMALNSEDTGINNLDLNSDRRVDYINVTDHVDGRVHNIVLSVALNKKHRQDVAVFIVERFRDGSAQVQLVGDEALYGRNYIVEPYYDNNYAETANPGYYGRPAGNGQVTVVVTSAWEIASWPLVHHIYYPGYHAWQSPWYWGYWPAYYTAWDPWYWHYYNGYHSHWNSHYYAHFRHWNHVRYHGYHDFYYAGVRHYSKDVHKNIKKGYYKETYSRPELQNEGRALHTRVATESNRTRVNAGTREASATRLSSAVPETARMRSASVAAARRPEGTVATRTASEVGTLRSGTISDRQEAGTARTRTEAGTIRSKAGATGKSATRSEAVETRKSAPATSGATYSRPATTRSTGTRETAPAVIGESRTRTSGARAPEVTSKVVTRTEMAPRTTTTAREASTTSGTARSTGISTRSSSSGYSGSTKVATRPAEVSSNNSGSYQRSSSPTVRNSSSSGSSIRTGGSTTDSSSSRSRR